MSTTGNLGLYVHIPFCSKKCPYCHFYVIPDKKWHKDLFATSLFAEWELQKEKLQSYQVDTIYFGGGTPTLFPEIIPKFIESIAKDAHLHPDAEITCEANPENLTPEILSCLKKAGVNRLSIGVQSFDDKHLLTLGRDHSGKKAYDAIGTALSYIDNISVDIMYDTPNEKPSHLEKSILWLKQLPITHLSLYNLTIEKHTSFYKNRNKLHLPTQKQSEKHLRYLLQEIQRMGFYRYEISAFCKKGKFSRHNVKYWKNEDVLGFGPSACSYVKGRRWKNLANILKYHNKLSMKESIEEYSEILSPEKSYRLSFCLALRLIEGACRKKIESSPYYVDIEKEIQSLVKEELLSVTDHSIQLTAKGLWFHDWIAERLI